jgi:3-methylfumaryl-CoA hydratase
MTEDFSTWVGRTEHLTDTLDPSRSNALAAALGDPATRNAGEPLPLLHHWLYFWDVRPPAGLGPDGHPARGGFLPPVPLPRRMWAGGRLSFHAPLLLGEEVRKTSTILKVEAKSGKSGELVFVTVEHRLEGSAGLAITEQQDIVYREASAAGSVPLPAQDAPAPDAAWRRDIDPDPVLLFRYSGLTMNGHRIHYDRSYAIDEEAYPALVVHGPLMATLLADLGARNLSTPVTGFEFRGQSPAFDSIPLHVCGKPSESGANLWTEQGGSKRMVATMTCGS